MASILEDMICLELGKDRQIDLVILYGSFAKGKQHSLSDVDIAIAGATKFSIDTLLQFSLHLEDVLQRQIDLVDLSQIHGILLHEIFQHGKCLIQRNPTVYVRHLMRYVTEQADFMPAYRRLLHERRKRFLHGSTTR